MTRLSWDQAGAYESGVDRGVLYLDQPAPVAWSGLTAVNPAPVAEVSDPVYIDGVKAVDTDYLESFAATIEAVTYPDEFLEYAGYDYFQYGGYIDQARRKSFGFSYRTLKNDGSSGYKIHLVYNAVAEPAQVDHKTLSQTVEVEKFAWKITTTPMLIENYKRTAHVVIDTGLAHQWAVDEIEDALYGTSGTTGSLPTPEEVLSIFENAAILKVIDNGDGSFTVIGPDEAIQMLDPTTFSITWSSAVYIDEDSYVISSL